MFFQRKPRGNERIHVMNRQYTSMWRETPEGTVFCNVSGSYLLYVFRETSSILKLDDCQNNLLLSMFSDLQGFSISCTKNLQHTRQSQAKNS